MTTKDEPRTLRSRLIGPAVILAAAFIAIVPELFRGASCGHDFDVHLVSWFDCLNAWRHGIVYPHWAPSPNYGAGEPRFVFYPPLTWMLGAALSAVLPWSAVPIVLTWIILAASGLATRALARLALSESQATLAGCVAIFSGYALFTGYERAAFPEFAGGFWLPLVMLFAQRTRKSSAGVFRAAFDGSTVPLAIALAGAWLSNLPLGVMAAYLLAGIALLAAVSQKSWAPVFRAAVGGALGLGLAAFYWLPAALERDWVDVRQATQDPGYNLEHNWLFIHNSNPALALHDSINHQVSWIAISMLVAAIAGFVAAWRRRTLNSPTGSMRWWVPLAAIPVGISFLSFPVSSIAWHALPEMTFIQYPWRWLEAVEAPMAIFVVAAIWPAARRVRMAVCVACAIGFIAAVVYADRNYFQACYPEDAVPAMLASYNAGAGFEGMFEYAPPGSDITTIAQGLPDACLVSDAEAELGKPDPDDPDTNPIWAADQGSCIARFSWDGGAARNPEHLRMSGVAPQAGWLVLRQTSFPAWRVIRNGQPLHQDRVNQLRTRPDGLIAVRVERGPVDLAADWTTSGDVWFGRWVSAISLVLAMAVAWFERRFVGARQH